jgi:hypothetical protein
MALKVIGAGFGRTGTMSLKVALEQLGFPCYHMVECFPKGPSHWKLWEAVDGGDPDWDAIFRGYTAAVDFPTCTSYAALAEHYPDARVVLTVRDPGSWFDSVQGTIFGREWLEFLPTSEAGPYMKATIDDYFDGRMHDRDHLLRRFDEHVAAVQAAIPPERLLVFQVAEGWKPLCEFLDLPAPESAFPNVNDTEAVRGIIREIMDKGFQAALGYAG